MEIIKNKKWWWLWAVSLLALGTIVVSIYNPKPGPAVFDFNDGTVQGWTFDGVYDDAGTKFNGTYFPPTTLKNLQGELVFFPDQLGLALNQAGFPKTSAFWRVDFVSPNLGPVWNGLKGIKVSARDQIGLVDSGLEVRTFVRYAVGGQTSETPAVSSFNPTLPHDKLTVVSDTMNLPPNAKLLNIIVRVRGRWATPGSPVIQLYEGQVYIDDVTKVY